MSQAAQLVSLGAWSCDLETEQLSWTQGVFDIFGWSSEEVPDRRCAVEMYCEESRELLERKRRQAIETGSQFSLDARIFQPEGSARWIRITAATRSFNGRARSLYGMKQDITGDYERWERLRAQAECDPLTGLANRAPFQRFLEQPRHAPALKSTGALLLFDLDGFKQVNDWWGHAAGDACLVAFAKRLREAFSRAELIARIGGDEFAVLLPPLQSRAATHGEISVLVTQLLSPVPWDGRLLPLGASAGLACAPSSGDFDPQELFTEADRALYNAKESASTHLVCA